MRVIGCMSESVSQSDGRSVRRPVSQWLGGLVIEWVRLEIELSLSCGPPRYLFALQSTFSFPQSLGIAGGRPNSSTYLLGVTASSVLYLDPHCAQAVRSRLCHKRRRARTHHARTHTYAHAHTHARAYRGTHARKYTCTQARMYVCVQAPRHIHITGHINFVPP